MGHWAWSFRPIILALRSTSAPKFLFSKCYWGAIKGMVELRQINQQVSHPGLHCDFQVHLEYRLSSWERGRERGREQEKEEWVRWVSNGNLQFLVNAADWICFYFTGRNGYFFYVGTDKNDGSHEHPEMSSQISE